MSGAFSVMVPAKYNPPPSPAPPQVAADQECADRLLAHLNCHKVYYNSLLWLLEDPNERFCRFDNIVCGDVSLADLVVPEPLAVLGCYVAFPKSGSEFVPYEGEPIVDERLLTLPTSGIFADAALGRCTTCERVDPEVYWDWKDSPLRLRRQGRHPQDSGGIAADPGRNEPLPGPRHRSLGDRRGAAGGGRRNLQQPRQHVRRRPGDGDAERRQVGRGAGRAQGAARQDAGRDQGRETRNRDGDGDRNGHGDWDWDWDWHRNRDGHWDRDGHRNRQRDGRRRRLTGGPTFLEQKENTFLHP